MRTVTVLAACLVGSIGYAQAGDREIDTLNLCMYRNGLLGIQLGLKPADMRKSLDSICEKEIYNLVRSIM